MADIYKHRDETRGFSVDFADDLGSSEALSGTPTVVISTGSNAAGWTDKSTDFGTMSPAISGTTVTFTLNAGTSGLQDGGDYRVVVSCGTDASNTLVYLVEGRRPVILRVVEDGDPDAP